MAKRRTRLWLLPVMLAAAGFCYLDNCTVQTTFRTLRCATLPEAFSGLRIVQISDLHGRVFGKEHAALLDAVRAAKPDLIANAAHNAHPVGIFVGFDDLSVGELYLITDEIA